MPLFDYDVFHDGALVLSQTAGSVPTGGSTDSLNINLPATVPITYPVLRRSRGGVQRGSHELRFAILPQVSGAGGSGGVFLALQSALGNKNYTIDQRNVSAYSLEFDSGNVDLVNFKLGIHKSTLFTGSGLTTGSPGPVGPGNWLQILFQLFQDTDGSHTIKVRQTAAHVNVTNPAWSRIESLPDVYFSPQEALAPGWCGFYGFGTDGDLVRFNSLSLSNTLTEL